MVRCPNCMKEFDEKYGVCPNCGFVYGSTAEESFHLNPGTILHGNYVIGTTLGFGGFGITYKAWDNTLGIMVAVKEYYPNGIVNRVPGEKNVIIYSGSKQQEFENGRKRFLDEARNMAKFSTHPNIVNVYNFFEENNTAYIVMEFLDGVSFKQYTAKNGGKVDLDTSLQVALAVIDALREIHKLKIIHRDVSPDNIFICSDGRIKLIDFGAARFSSGLEEKTLSIVLKPGYAPPEQYRSRSKQGPWTDIYALGAVLYRSLTGKMPEESVNRVIEDKLIEPVKLNPEIPDYVNTAILRAMALKQELRFQNVDQFKEALLNQRKVRDVDAELAKRKTNRILTVSLIGLALLMALAVCVFAFVKKKTEARLDPAAITVWVPEKDASEEAKYEDLFSEFETAYPQVKAELSFVPADQYTDKLEESLGTADAPDLFCSTDLLQSHDSDLEPLNQAYSLVKAADFYYLKDYAAAEGKLKKMPLSFQMPVVYANASAGKTADRTEEEKKNLPALTIPDRISGPADFSYDGRTSYAVDDAAASEYGNLNMENAGAETYQDFQDNRTAFFLSDTARYFDIQKDFSGRYSVLLPDRFDAAVTLYGRYDNTWSVNALSPKEEKAAAVRAVYYLLSERAQEIMNIQLKKGLPLSKTAYAAFVNVNGEFQGLAGSFDSVKLR